MSSSQYRPRQFTPDMESVRTHQVPQWFDDCKLGIFIHWGAYSVPAYAPPTCELGDIPIDIRWFSNNPYSEWYMNSVRVGQGPSYEHHVATYGKDFPYENFTDMWKAENWNAAEWADLFKKSGAGYIVPVTKHHDGFCLWPSKYTDYHTGNRGPMRDIIGELATAVREEGMKFGVYYSGILDWTYTTVPICDEFDVHNPPNITAAYADYAFNQATELIDRYQPSVFWNDIDWPKKGIVDLPALFSYYYNNVPEGVVNDRWNGVWADYTTKEYKYGQMTLDKKWEMCRGLGLSFAYNQVETDEHYIQPNKLIALLLESVSHNGNLLINVGPKADGTIPAEQRDRLLYLGQWLSVNGDAIYGTKTWTRQQERLAGGIDCYFTSKNDKVYIMLDNVAAGSSTVVIPGLAEAAATIRPLAASEAEFAVQGPDLKISLANIPAGSPALAFVFG